ncbi:MAG: TetR/AcrR family transcriptional regulator [Chloroflexota bacterium]
MTSQLNKTQKRILDATFELLAQDVSTPLEKIADAAGITRMTLHRYYSGRQALLEAAVTEMMGISNQIIENGVTQHDEPVDQLKSIVKEASLMGDRFHFLTHAFEEIDSSFLDSKVEELDDQMFKIFDALRADNLIADNMTNDWLIHLYGGILMASWSSFKEGKVGRAMIPSLAWQSFKGAALKKQSA